MRSHNFIIIASGLDVATDDGVMDRLFEAGCDDATVSVQKGLTVLEFDRAARNFVSALVSAVADVLRAGGKVERIEPDHLVNASDIARRSGLGRAAISLYVSGARREGFPRPVARVTTESPLWDWVEVASWLRRGDKLQPRIAVEARLIREINRVIAERRPSHPVLMRKLAVPKQKPDERRKAAPQPA